MAVSKDGQPTWCACPCFETARSLPRGIRGGLPQHEVFVELPSARRQTLVEALDFVFPALHLRCTFAVFFAAAADVVAAALVAFAFFALTGGASDIGLLIGL